MKCDTTHLAKLKASKCKKTFISKKKVKYEVEHVNWSPKADYFDPNLFYEELSLKGYMNDQR